MAEIINFKKKAKPIDLQKNSEKDILVSLYALPDGRKVVHDESKNKIFLLRPTKGTDMSANVANVSDLLCLKILIPKQMLQILPIALAQEKASNTSENLLK